MCRDTCIWIQAPAGADEDQEPPASPIGCVGRQPPGVQREEQALIAALPSHHFSP